MDDSVLFHSIEWLLYMRSLIIVFHIMNLEKEHDVRVDKNTHYVEVMVDLVASQQIVVASPSKIS